MESSLNQFDGISPVLELCFRVRALGNQMIIPDQPIAHEDVTLRIGGDVLLMRDHDDGDTVLVELLEDCHDLDAVRLSRFPVGSSASGTSGSLINARAIATRCC